MEINLKFDFEKISELLAAKTILENLIHTKSNEIGDPRPAVQEVPPPTPPEAPPAPKADTIPPPPPKAAPKNGTWPQPGVNGVLLDSAGLPWDERINSDNKKCVAKDGRWRKRRNCDPTYYKEVEAELTSAKIGQQVQAMDDTPPPPPPAPKATDGPDELTFSSLMEWLPKQDPKYTEVEGLNALAKQVGLDSIAFLAAHGEKIPELVKIVQDEQSA